MVEVFEIEFLVFKNVILIIQWIYQGKFHTFSSAQLNVEFSDFRIFWIEVDTECITFHFSHNINYIHFTFHLQINCE